MLEKQLWSLREAWWDVTTGQNLQKLYLELREWNYEECLPFEPNNLRAVLVRNLVLPFMED